MSDSNSEIDMNTPPDIVNAATNATNNLLPQKSRAKYEMAYKDLLHYTDRSVSHNSADIKAATSSDPKGKNMANVLNEFHEKPVLPETITVKFSVYMNSPYGPCGKYEQGRLFRYYLQDEEPMQAKPSTTVDEMKVYLRSVNPVLIYDDMELAYWNDYLPDAMTLEEICIKWPFMESNIIKVQTFQRDRKFRRINFYFRGMGKEKAKNNATAFTEFLDTAQKITDSVRAHNNVISDHNAEEIKKTLMNFVRITYEATEKNEDKNKESVQQQDKNKESVQPQPGHHQETPQRAGTDRKISIDEMLAVFKAKILACKTPSPPPRVFPSTSKQ